MEKRRMYFLTMYNISDIQKGIQCGHCVEQYARKYGNDIEYQNYVDFDKTWIILNGGTSNNSIENPGTLQIHLETIKELGIKYATFNEPDLNDALTAICFLVEESTIAIPKLDDFIKSYDVSLDDVFADFFYAEKYYQTYGEKNLKLKEFISQFRLA